ncbi:MAG TPA: TonB-dependent receptor, partial [Lacunisphaera sp.]|nr:TonB-dependent receptor [Lacunisphaera sp.]
YSNAARGFNAPQTSLSLQHGQSLLDGRLHLLLNATFTEITPPTESQLNHHRGLIEGPVTPGLPIYAATPNIRSADGAPLFGPGSSPYTSVAPGADGSGGLTPFLSREGLLSLGLFDPPGDRAASVASLDNPYGRAQRRAAYFGSAVWDVLPTLQIGLDGFYSRTIANRGYDVLNADLDLAATSPFNPFGREVRVSLNETAPLLGQEYSQGSIESYSAVAGALLKLPSEWRVMLDAQYASNITKYRGLAAPDLNRWQQLVDSGVYNPLRDTQVHGPPQEFYDQVLVYYGDKGRFVTLGNFDAVDTALRITNQSLSLPTGSGVINAGADYRVVRLADYTQRLHYADGSDAVPPSAWTGRMLERYSVFGEMEGPLLPAKWLPSWLHRIDADVALRYVASASAEEANYAPTAALKFDFAGGWSFRGSVTTASRFPNPELSISVGSGSGGPSAPAQIVDPRLGGIQYSVDASSPNNPSLHTEDAVTQTAGLLFQRGREHHFRASLDFVDTRTVNEIDNLTPQSAVDLEAVFPDRVVRAAPAPGQPVGLITQVFTGDVNAASRHSQDWNLSLDYTWKDCFGGTLDLYGRLVYFQKYDLQLVPDSPAVDELNHPDHFVLSILKLRSNFGASWSNDRIGFGLDGRYFHARELAPDEQISQGSSQIDPYWEFDAYVQADLARWLPWLRPHHGLRAQVRVNNLFDSGFPRFSTDPYGAGVEPYGDWRGRTYSLSLTATY